MAVSQAQFNTASTGSGTTTSLACSLSSNATIGQQLVAVVVSDQPINLGTSTPWTVIGTQSGPPYVNVFRFTAAAALTYVFTAGFSVAAHISIAVITCTAASVSGVTFGTGSGNSTLSAQGTTPPYWAPLTGDLPYGFFASSGAASPTTQSGWTQLANLNSTAGQFAQLQVQRGPATTTTPQSPTAQTTWSGAAGFSEIGAIVTFSGAGPYSMTSQEYGETVGSGPSSSRTTQENLQVVGQGVPKSHMSQAYIEAFSQDTALARTSQAYIELIIPLVERTTQIYAETFAQDTAKARVSQVYLEVLYSSQGARRRTLDDEMFTL